MVKLSCIASKYSTAEALYDFPFHSLQSSTKLVVVNSAVTALRWKCSSTGCVVSLAAVCWKCRSYFHFPYRLTFNRNVPYICRYLFISLCCCYQVECVCVLRRGFVLLLQNTIVTPTYNNEEKLHQTITSLFVMADCESRIRKQKKTECV